jgi:hypothetical protein
MPLLTAKPFDFTDRYPLDADLIQGFFDLIQFEGLNDGFDFPHDSAPLSIYYQVPSLQDNDL